MVGAGNQELRFDLPLGPSVNQMYPGKGRRYKSGLYRNWISTAGWHIRASRPPPLRMVPFSVRILVPEQMRGDPDNRIKAILDLLVRNGVTPDDKYVHKVSVERSSEAFPGRCIVYVFPISETIKSEGAEHGLQRSNKD